MRRKFVLLALRYPELNLLLLRRTLPELRENHIIPLQRELYGIAPYNSTERVFRFPNGKNCCTRCGRQILRTAPEQACAESAC